MADKDNELLKQLNNLASYCDGHVKNLTEKMHATGDLTNDEVQFMCLHSSVLKRLHFIIENLPYLRMSCEEYNKAIKLS